MPVRVVLHLETTDEGTTVWWAETPELGGFSATDKSLQRLADLCEAAIVEAYGHEATIAWAFADEDATTGGETADPERVQVVQYLVTA